MKPLLCRLLGHKWRALTRGEIRDCLERKDLKLAKCSRCGWSE